VQAGVVVLGVGRSGTSAATRLISFLGFETPHGEDLVPPSDKNPRGYWESMSLVSLNVRILETIGSHSTCPIALLPGWQEDARLDDLRREAPMLFRKAFPSGPWVWKDPRTCLTFAFWREVFDVQPLVVVVSRNPLEIVASSTRMRGEERRIYSFALWERYLRQVLRDVEGMRVLITDFAELLAAPLKWTEGVHEFLTAARVPALEPRESDVLSFVDGKLRHSQFTAEDFMHAHDVSGAQLRLFEALQELRGVHQVFVPPPLPDETPTTEALLAERRRARQIQSDLMLELQRQSLRPVRRIYSTVRRLAGTGRALLA
jgi:hypothetical protein